VEKVCSCKFCFAVLLILKILCGYFLTHPCRIIIRVIIKCVQNVKGTVSYLDGDEVDLLLATQ
jgi:hypothetical protein